MTRTRINAPVAPVSVPDPTALRSVGAAGLRRLKLAAVRRIAPEVAPTFAATVAADRRPSRLNCRQFRKKQDG